MGNVHEKLKQKLAGARSGFGWKPKDGDNRIFVLPPAAQYVENLDAVEQLAFKFKTHYFKIEGRQATVSRCLQEVGQKCPACAAWVTYKGSTDPGLKERARQISPADAYVFNILDLNDLQKGVQRWAANWTCWTGIMEIASNPQWGYVFDPKNGIAFVVQLTPGARSRTGYNSYSVMPEPTRITVMDILMANEAGLSVLDGLEEQVSEQKTAEEIQTMLDEMGFPPPSGGKTPAPAFVQPANVVVAAPRPVAAVAPAAVRPVAAPVTLAAPAPVAVAAPVAPVPVAPTPTPAGRSVRPVGSE